MARGFGATLGSATTDILRPALTAHATTRSYAAWVLRIGSGGGSLGRILDKNNGSQVEVIYYAGSGSDHAYYRGRGTTDGSWNFTTGITTGVWYHFCLTYDAGSTTNDPVVYINGSSVTVTETSTPAGSVTTNADSYSWGNRQSGVNRNWDGSFAEAGIWDAILTADEVVALAKGAPPSLIRPQSLASYVPMLRDNTDLKLAAPSITGTAVQPHPRVFYPVGMLSGKFTTGGGGGGGFKAAWARNANTVLYSGARAA